MTILILYCYCSKIWGYDYYTSIIILQICAVDIELELKKLESH